MNNEVTIGEVTVEAGGVASEFGGMAAHGYGGGVSNGFTGV